MKQNITIEQLQELTPKQMEKLLKWWNNLDYSNCPKCGSITIEYDRGPDNWEDDITYTSYVCPTCNATYHGWFDIWQSEDYDLESGNQLTPLLSIGQCIEFISDNTNEQAIRFNDDSCYWFIDLGINVPHGNYATYCEFELINALWEAVKKVLG